MSGTVRLDGNRLVIDGSVFGEETGDGTVQVPAGKVTSANGSVVIQNENQDICIGTCPGVSGEQP